MRIRSILSKKMLYVFLLVTLSCFAPALASPPAGDNCKVQRIDLPDPSNLPDGDHVIKEADTDGGRFQAHVSVKNKVASRPRFTIGGRPLRDISESQVPRDLKNCLDNAQRSAGAASTTNLPVSVKRFVNSFDPATYVYCKTVFVSCARALNGTYYCVAKVCCDGVCAFGSN